MKPKSKLHWYQHIAYFLGGAFLANAIPHFMNGISGHAFQSPFATPPGEGLSSATVNVLWGSFNFVMSYLLLGHVGSFEWRRPAHIAHMATGAILMAVLLAHAFGRFYGGA